ncbi:hypothetical protein [Paenibacillus sp. FSL R7-0333]|uniref:hypothetical protein n=1 Tax=Paenibacillus sp. FSL R7-0333 TaxID=1926587 RepID=UPI00096EA46A|nr:hypothetical protein BK146_17815 [Paenibacillus sp. FSL R7-0333]
MTPERKEELKKKYKNMDYFTMQHNFGLLLAALEETQQQNERLRKNFMFSGSALAEAQQTIARLESELEDMTVDRNLWRSNSTDWEGQEELEDEEGETQP